MRTEDLKTSSCHAATFQHGCRRRESVVSSYPAEKFDLSRKWERPLPVTSFMAAVLILLPVVPYLLTPSCWWRLCGAMLHRIEIILTLTATLQAHATVFFPSEKITITLEWNINQGVEKEKDGQVWRGRASERKEPIRDDVLFLDQCWSEGAPNGGGMISFANSKRRGGNGSLKMTYGESWMKIFVFVHHIWPFFSVLTGIVLLTFPERRLEG